MTARTRGLLSSDQEPLIHLLEAQTALIEGKYDDARKKFELMADDPETRELGLRGLYLEAKRLGANEAARQYAERAADKAPHLPWATLAALDYRSQTGQWDEAIRLLDQSRAGHVIDRKEADRKKAVLLTARATEKLEADPKGARDDALAAAEARRGPGAGRPDRRQGAVSRGQSAQGRLDPGKALETGAASGSRQTLCPRPQRRFRRSTG